MANGQGWKSTDPPSPRPIKCGQTDDFSTWGQGNDFSSKDYTKCISGDIVIDDYNGNDVIYEINVEVESDIRFTIESNCPKGLFLMQEEGNTLSCIAFHELDPNLYGATMTFFGGVRVTPGKYFLVIDERASDMCEMFELTLECLPYVPYTICELGGLATSCGKTNTGSFPAPPEPAPTLGKTPKGLGFEVPCDTIVNYQIYQAYFENPVAISTELLGVTNGEVFIFSEAAACNNSVICAKDFILNPGNVGKGVLNNAAPGFYYFLVIGDAAENFTLKVTTNDCICDFVPETIIPNVPITDDAITATNKFDNVNAQGLDAYTNCYGRNRPYTGGDKIYQFEVDVQSKVSIRLQSAFEAGLFLFDANCATDCLGYAETFGINGTTELLEFEVACGVYQLVVDLAEPHVEACPFTVEIFAIEANLQADMENPIRPTDVIHEMEVLGNLSFNVTPLNPNDENLVSFFADGRNPDCPIIPINEGYQIQQSAMVHDLYGEDPEDGIPPKIAYDPMERFQQKLVKEGRDIGFVDAIIVRIRLFTEKIRSTLVQVSKVDTRPGVIRNLEISEPNRIVSSKGGSVDYTIFSNQSTLNADLNTDWCITVIEGESFLNYNNIGNVGSERMTFDFGPNESSIPKAVTFQLQGPTINSNREFTIIQESKFDCEEDLTPPSIECPLDSIFEIANPSNSIIVLLDQILTRTNLTFYDECTPTDDLQVRFRKKPQPINNTPQRIDIVVTDLAGNENVCPIWIKAADSFNSGLEHARVSQRNNQNLDLIANLTVYPNPSKGEFQIVLPENLQEINDINIFNTLGQRIKTIPLSNISNNRIIDVNMQDFKEGIYLLQVKEGQQLLSKKFLISKS